MASDGKRARKGGRRGKRWRVPVLLCLFGGGLLFALFSLSSSQEREDRGKKSAVGQERELWARGSFFDCNRKKLVTTVERVSVYVRSREIVSFSQTAKALAKALSLDETAIENRLRRGGLRIWIAEDITQQQEEAVRKLGRFGVHLQKEKKRYYPYDAYGAHILGFADNGIGLSGLEALYDQLLAEKKKEELQKGETLTYQQDLILTLDLKIQKILEEVLSEVRREAVLQGVNMRAAAYLLDSKSGAFLAGAQAPGFNPNTFASYGGDILENMFFAPFFIPDSIRALLRDCAGFYKTENDAVLAGAWCVSPSVSNAGRQLQLMEKLGFGQLPEVDFYTAKKIEKKQGGQIRRIRRQRNMAMIPEISTPLNLLVALSSLLHGRPESVPYTVLGVVDGTGREMKRLKQKPLVQEQFALPERAVKRLFVAAGKKLKHGVIVKGESLGQFLLADGGREFIRNNVVFVDIPAGGNPMALLLVTETRERGPFVKAQTRRKSPLDIARIVAKKIGRISILHMVTIGAEGLVEQEAEQYGNYQSEERFTVENDIVMHRRRGEETAHPLKMPDLQGMSLRKALQHLQGVPVKLSIEGFGQIRDQYPPAGTELKKDTLCRLILEQGAAKGFDGFDIEAEGK